MYILHQKDVFIKTCPLVIFGIMIISIKIIKSILRYLILLDIIREKLMSMG